MIFESFSCRIGSQLKILTYLHHIFLQFKWSLFIQEFYDKERLDVKFQYFLWVISLKHFYSCLKIEIFNTCNFFYTIIQVSLISIRNLQKYAPHWECMNVCWKLPPLHCLAAYMKHPSFYKDLYIMIFIIYLCLKSVNVTG